MDYMDWKILSMIEKENNLTLAAEKLFITQPALTYRIRSLEKELGVSLLLRTNKGVILTNQGIVVAEYASKMIKEYNNMKDVVCSMDQMVRGSVQVAVSHSFAQYKLTNLLICFTKEYPLIDIHIKTETSDNVINLMLNDKVHIAIARGNYKLNCKMMLLNEEPVTLISKEKIRLKDLPNLPYIMYQTNSSLERMIANWWRENYDVPPKTVMHINDSFTCRQLVSGGLGFSVLPDLDASKLFKLYKKNLNYKNGEPLIRPTWLLYKEATCKILAVQLFIQFLLKRNW